MRSLEKLRTSLKRTDVSVVGFSSAEGSLGSCSQGWYCASAPEVSELFMLQPSTSLESSGSWQVLVLVLLSLELDFLIATIDC